LLSRHVRQLEVELHQNLLLRNGRGVTLTQAGLVLLEHGRGILHQVALAQEELGSVRGALSGRIAIGLPPSLSRLTTVPLTLAVKKHLPQAQLTLTEGFSLSMTENLRSGRLDLAVMYNPPADPDIESKRLWNEALVLISSKNNSIEIPKSKISLCDLAQLPIITPTRPNAFRLLIEAEMQRIQCRPHIVMEIDGLTAILELVKQGLGFAVLPAYTLHSTHRPQDYTTHNIEKPKLKSELCLVWSARRPLTSTHRKAMEVTEQVITKALSL
jgi:LysR family transcriptional regulator, nitrogen assimilation regulatory protein